MKRQLFQSTALAMMAFAPVKSQTVAESEGRFTISPTIVSAYMFRGVRQGGLSFQPTIGYQKGPLELELFANFPISDRIPGTCDPEIDFGLYYTWTLVPEIFSIKPGLLLYTYPSAKESDGQNIATFEPSVFFEYSIGDLTFSLNCFYDIVLRGPTYELGAEYLIHAKPLHLDFELSALTGRYDWSDSDAGGIRKRNAGNYFIAGAAIPIEFSKKSSLKVGWYFSKGTNNYLHYSGIRESNPGAIGKGFIEASYSFSF
jgi:hypothetical protein